MDVTCAEIVADFYDASVNPAAWPQALHRLMAILEADACALVRRDFATGDGQFGHTAGIDARLVSAYASRYSRADVWLHDEKLCQLNTVFAGSDAVSPNTLVNSVFYAEWLQIPDFLHAAFVVIHRQGRTATLLCAYRRSARAAFAESELKMLADIAPRLTAAYRLGLEFARQRATYQAACEALNAMPIGVVTLDRAGGVLHANSYAQALLAAGEGIVRSENGLTLERPGLRVRLREVVAQAGQARQGGPHSAEVPLFSVPRYRQQRPLSCLVAPLTTRQEEGVGAEAANDRAAALFYVADPERVVVFEPMRISRLYGLSRAEGRVAALLARGHRLEEAADNLGIAYETVRKHLKQIFTKTGVSRQAELVRMLVTGPAGLAISSGFTARTDRP